MTYYFAKTTPTSLATIIGKEICNAYCAARYSARTEHIMRELAYCLSI